MIDLNGKDFKKIYEKEKDGKISERMLAVRMVLEKNMTHKETGDILMKCPEWVGKWVARFREGSIDALRGSSQN